MNYARYYDIYITAGNQTYKTLVVPDYMLECVFAYWCSVLSDFEVQVVPLPSETDGSLRAEPSGDNPIIATFSDYDYILVVE
ncbi:hypothetical protein [Sigmofec virus UA08Rod_5594]|uniref:Uncharacterized protein n=1 Tax=Sigmofec virus UA08Rod_5594 TaxID=2929430 RepID=A0A976R596_9VIRU|nr:hypothetical protein [Sigmofec virus UA08Rod_5594]